MIDSSVPFLPSHPLTYHQVYGERKGVNADALRFLFNGERIQGTQTPHELGFGDDDHIDVVLLQEGGDCIGGKEEEEEEDCVVSI